MKKASFACVLLSVIGAADASGFRFGSQSVASQGNADANSAEGHDPSTQFFNPAGLVRLKGTEMQFGGTLALPRLSYEDKGSTRFTGGATGGKNPDGITPEAVVVPSFYLSRELGSDLTAGLGMFVPYGAKLDYGKQWPGRYALTHIEMQSLNINPSIAWKVNERNALGFGISVEYLKARFGQGADVPGTIAALAGAGGAPALMSEIVRAGGNPAALASARDAYSSAGADGWGLGFNLGYMFQLAEGTRFGVAYRSSVHHKLKGRIGYDFTGVTRDQVVNHVLAIEANRSDSPVSLRLDTPETVSVNGYHELDGRWAVMGDLTWSRTSRLKALNIRFDGTASGDEVIAQDWRDTYRLSLGANYRVDDRLVLRAGWAFDQAPVRSVALTHPGLPDGHRRWYSLGARYALDQASAIDLAYSFVHFATVDGNYTNGCNPTRVDCTGNGETTKGTYRTRLQFLGLAYRFRF